MRCDWGSVVSDVMACQAPAGLLGIHVNMPATVPENVAKASATAGLSDKEKAAFESLKTFYTKSTGYNAVTWTDRPNAPVTGRDRRGRSFPRDYPRLPKRLPKALATQKA
jgi:hypothetical protein